MSWGMSDTKAGQTTTATEPLDPEVGAVPRAAPVTKARPVEIGGPKGPEPTRYGDWERGGRCVDF